MQPAERWPLRRRLSIVVDRFRTSDFGLGERLDLAGGQLVGDATLAFFGATGSLGPESIDADTAALGQAELGHFGSAVFFPDACAEEDRGDVFEVLVDTLTKVVGKVEASGCGGPRNPAEQRCKEAEEESCRRRSRSRRTRDPSTALRRTTPPGVTQKHSRPNHPTTCGKVERFHQTLKKWLTAQTRRNSRLQRRLLDWAR